MSISSRWRGSSAIAIGLLATASVASAQRRGGGPQEAPFNVSPNPILSEFRFRGVGPASMGGRIDDIEVSLTNPNVIYIGYATSGVWKSDNGGVSYERVFNSENTASIGDIAIDPTNENIVYVGTGEANNRQTNSFGDGVYKTVDGGKTWTHLGLAETQSIGRIIIDPRNPQVIYLAAEGHLFGPNKERGIYKSINGGTTWDLVKFIDENTGFSDITMDPANSNILYAASYQRRRTSCCFNGGGPGSGLWKSEDAGKTWKKFENLGIPAGLTVGRIAVAVAPSNPNVVYAQVQVGETGTPMPAAARGGGGGGGGGGRGGAANPADAYSVVDNGNDVICHGTAPANAFPGGNTAAAAGRGRGNGGARGGRAGGAGAGRAAVADSGAAAAPSAPDPKQGGVFRSNDKGKTWTLMNNCDSRPMYFSQVRVDPTNPDIVYISDLPVDKSVDGGKNFFNLEGGNGGGSPAHVDQHARWIDPKNPNHLMIGNDGGLDVSWDAGKSWDFVNTMTASLSYIVTADMRRPYYVYTGLQDNGAWGGPSSTRAGGIYNSDWFSLCSSGDGFYTAVNAEKPWIVYAESQNGGSSRCDFKTGNTISINPRNGGRGGGGGGGAAGGRMKTLNAQPGEQYRFNWNTPFVISPHDQNILWYGGNRLFKSYDGGETYVESADLTKQIDRDKVSVMGVAGDKTMLAKNDGLTAYSTIITISESPVMPGVVWVGTDDGNVQVSPEGNMQFTEVSKNLPGLKPVTDPANEYWISRVEASHFDVATAYVAVDGHRSDDLHPHVYVTHDFGKTFTDISNNLPAYGNVQVIREDPKNANLLFVGTEFGLYVSLNAGKSWEKFMNDYPTARTDDILIHPRDGDLIVATHAQGIMIADDITSLEQFTPAVQGMDAYLFQPREAVAYFQDATARQYTGGQRGWEGRNAPNGTAISYYLKNAAANVSLMVTNPCGVSTNLNAPTTAGINRIQYPAAGGGGNGGGGGAGFAQGAANGAAAARDTTNGAAAANAAGGRGAGRGNRGGANGRGAGAGGAGAGAGAPAAPGGQGAGFVPPAADNGACGGGAGGGGRGGRGGGGGALMPGVYTAKLTVNGTDYTRTFEVVEDKWVWDKWAIDPVK